MKNIITILFISLSLSSIAQNGVIPNIKGERNLYIGFNFSPDICYRTLTTSDTAAIINYIVDHRNAYEVPKLGYTTGISIRLDLTNRISLESGINFSNKGYHYKWTDLYFGAQVDPRYGFNVDSTNAIVRAKFCYRDFYIDVPLNAIYYFGRKRMHFNLGIGLTTNVFIGEYVVSTLEQANGKKERYRSSRYDDLARINLSPTIFFGATYNINDRIQLGIEPGLRYGILSIVDAPISGYLWNAGMNFKCYYKLGK